MVQAKQASNLMYCLWLGILLLMAIYWWNTGRTIVSINCEIGFHAVFRIMGKQVKKYGLSICLQMALLLKHKNWRWMIWTYVVLCDSWRLVEQNKWVSVDSTPDRWSELCGRLGKQWAFIEMKPLVSSGGGMVIRTEVLYVDFIYVYISYISEIYNYGAFAHSTNYFCFIYIWKEKPIIEEFSESYPSSAST